MQSNRNRVVEVPEILSSVVSRLDNWDYLQLMLVSKHFFRGVGPAVWKSVPRLDFLLRLIRGAKVHRYRFKDLQRAHYEFTEIKITLPPDLDLTRFNIYAPWIHELEIFGGPYSQELANPDPLLSLRAKRPLLPNLRRLTACTGSPIDGGQLLWFIDLFLCRSLTEIRTVLHDKGYHSHIEPAVIPGFLQKVLNTCPQIQTLEFYPQDSQTRSASDGPGAARYYIPGNEYRDTLASLSNLRSFVSTMYILQPETFSVLGNLPHLESLTIRGCREDAPVLDLGLSVPQTWFPNLKELRLYEVHPRDIVTLWNQPHIAGKLVSAYIHCDPTAPVDPFNDRPSDGNKWIDLFLLSLPRLSPNIKGFDLRVEDEDRTIFRLSGNARAAMRELGLRYFELDNPGEYADEEPSDYDEEASDCDEEEEY